MLRCWFFIAIFLFTQGKGFSQEVGQSVVVPNVEAIHDAIRDLRDGLLKAVNDKETDAIISFLHPDIVLTAQAGTALEVHRKHAGVRAYLEELLTGPESGVKELELDVKVDELTILYGDSTGVAFGSSNDRYVMRSGGRFDLATRWTATVVRDGPAWKIASLHVSSNLFDNPVVTALKNTAYIVVAVIGLLGFVVGIFFARVVFRRSSRLAA